MHGSDIPLVYGSLEAVSFPPAPPGSQIDASLSRMMMDYWISFATSEDSNPNDGIGVKRKDTFTLECSRIHGFNIILDIQVLYGRSTLPRTRYVMYSRNFFGPLIRDASVYRLYSN